MFDCAVSFAKGDAGRIKAARPALRAAPLAGFVPLAGTAILVDGLFGATQAV